REEYEIAGLDAPQVDVFAKPELLSYFARQSQPVLREHILHEPTAVESRRIAPAVAIGNAPEAKRRPNHCLPVEVRGRRRSRRLSATRRGRRVAGAGERTGHRARRGAAGGTGKEHDNKQRSHVSLNECIGRIGPGLLPLISRSLALPGPSRAV